MGQKNNLKNIRKKHNIDNKELDTFIGAKYSTTKYYIEKEYHKNRMFKYLLFLRTKGADINKFLDSQIKK